MMSMVAQAAASFNEVVGQHLKLVIEKLRRERYGLKILDAANAPTQLRGRLNAQLA